MRRREFIGLLCGAAAVPLAAQAQQGDHIRHIGVLMNFAKDDPVAKTRVAAFRQGLEKRGWSEGRNVHIDYRFTDSKAEHIPALKNWSACNPT
jgi:putative ABC transport system substrate-binding protein